MNIIYFIIVASSGFLAAMGMGGGSLFIILGSIFLEVPQKTLQGLNLIMFLASGVAATIFNFKNKTIDKGKCKKIVPFLIIGSIIGSYFAAKINEKKLSFYFVIFITIIGLYEIISSLINIKKEKNKSNI